MNSVFVFWARYRKSLWIVLFFTALFIAAGLSHLYFLDTPLRASREFFSSLSSDRVEEAYFSTASDFRRAGSLEQFRNFLVANEIFAHARKPSFKAQFPRPDFAVLTGTLVSEKGSPSPVTLHLQRFGGIWRLVSIDSRVMP